MLNRPINVLVLGSGAREHALCWKLAQSPYARQVYCLPGNGGTATTDKVKNVDINILDFEAMVTFCLESNIELTVVGPDNLLAEGVVDVLTKNKLRAFGPTKAASRLEWSKAYAKEFMSYHGIPTARSSICNTLEQSYKIVRNNAWARVIKVDGLALGKGVFVCNTELEAEEALKDIFESRRFGDAGNQVVIEERLSGQEISLIALCDGKHLVPLLPCQDNKRRFDGDLGPNTGGMGACAPISLYRQVEKVVESSIIQPIQRALDNKQLEYKGALYLGLMIEGSKKHSTDTNSSLKPYVLEFNARFGDPETQVLLPLLNSDLLSLLWACTNETLDKLDILWSTDSACCVVATTSAYPERSSYGEPITLGQFPESTFAFHAGTKFNGNQLTTNGGRVLCVTGVASNMETARKQAYAGIAAVKFASMAYRQDIGMRMVSCVN